MSIPENHVIAEGRNLRAALEDAAAKLGVPASLVEHKIDLAHFRSAAGTGVGADTVKIFAWSKDPADAAPALAAEEWMKGLLASMDRTGSVRADSRGGSVVVRVDVGEEGRHLVGRGGSTLRSIQHLMEQSVGPQFPGVSFRIDVARAEGDERREDRGERRDDRGDRGERRDDRGERRDDRGERRFGDRGDRRDDRRGRDDRGDRRGRDDRGRRGDGDSEDLRRLARKVAQIVLDRGEPEVIRRELNSYDRRLVHVEISGIAGVASRSVGEGADRRVEIYIPDASDEPASDEG